MSTNAPRAPSDLPSPARRLFGALRPSLGGRCPCPLVGLTLFLAVSLAAARGFGAAAGEADWVRGALGAVPPSVLIDAALAVYALAAIVRALAYAAGVEVAGTGFCGVCHAAFAAAFYAFYHLDGSLSRNYWPVFATGVVVLTLGALGTWGREARPLGERVRRR